MLLTLHSPTTQVAAATIHALALSEGGNVYSWGIDAGGRLGHGDGGAAEPIPRRIDALSQSVGARFWRPRVVEVAAAREHSLFLLDDGSLLSCGRLGPDTLVPRGIHGPARERERRYTWRGTGHGVVRQVQQVL